MAAATYAEEIEWTVQSLFGTEHVQVRAVMADGSVLYATVVAYNVLRPWGRGEKIDAATLPIDTATVVSGMSWQKARRATAAQARGLRLVGKGESFEVRRGTPSWRCTR